MDDKREVEREMEDLAEDLDQAFGELNPYLRPPAPTEEDVAEVESEGDDPCSKRS